MLAPSSLKSKILSLNNFSKQKKYLIISQNQFFIYFYIFIYCHRSNNSCNWFFISFSQRQWNKKTCLKKAQNVHRCHKRRNNQGGFCTKGSPLWPCVVESEGNPGSGSPLKGAPKPVMWPRLQLACPAIRSGSVRMCVSGSDVNPYLVFSVKGQQKKCLSALMSPFIILITM